MPKCSTPRIRCRLPGCKPSHSGVLGQAHTYLGMRPPSVLGLLGFRAANWHRTHNAEH
jgi:hypothetical protein